MLTQTPGTLLYLPRMVKSWPWPRTINPHYKEIGEECKKWMRGFRISKEIREALEQSDFDLLAGLAYPYSNQDQLRTGCDLLALTFLVDEYTDGEPRHIVQEIITIVLDAIHNPHKSRPRGEILHGQFAKEFWQRARATSTPEAQMWFLMTMTDYLNSVVVQASDRDHDYIRTVPEYLEARRENGAVKPCYFPGAMHLRLPIDVWRHPCIKELEDIIADMINLNNDILSYNTEQAHNNDHYNMVTILMHHHKMSYNGAVRWISQYHSTLEAKFLKRIERFPSFGDEIDAQIQEYILVLANWPRCNECWSFEGRRYFGSKGVEIERTRVVPLLPKV